MSHLTYRTPAWAGSFYPANRQELQHQIKTLSTKSQKTGGNLRAMIMPHAGYVYSGHTASYAENDLKKKQPKQIILLGPDHHVGMPTSHVCQKDFWQTPLGDVKISAHSELLQQQHPDIFNLNPLSDQKEHALEVIVPFLQTWLNDFDLLPIVTGQVAPDKLAQAITPLLTDDTVLVISSDLSHFLTDQGAQTKDTETIEAILSLNIQELLMGQNKACGLIPICALLAIATVKNWKPYVLHYSNSGDVSGDKDRVVGYATIGFYEGDQR